MSHRSPAPDQHSESSLTEMLEYGLTATLVLVVVVALLEVCGVRMGAPGSISALLP